MTFVDLFKHKLGQWALNQKLSHQINLPPCPLTLSDTQSIAIIFTIHQTEDIQSALDLKNKLIQQHNIKTQLLGLSLNPNITPKSLEPFLDIIFGQDLDWKHLPKLNRIAYFLNQSFDILINIDTTNSLTLNYIAASVAAKIKIGHHHSKNQKIYSVMFDAQHHSDTLVNTIIHYLQLAT